MRGILTQVEVGVSSGDTSGTAVVTDVFDRAVIPPSARPDDKAGPRGIGAASATSVRPDDRTGQRGPGTIQQPEITLLSDNGSEWTNYLIGAAGGLGASLLLMGGMAVALHFRRRHGPIALP